MRLEAAQYRELAAFAQFGSDLDEETKAKLNRGERLIEVFKQDQYQPMSTAKQVVIFFSAIEGLLDSIPVDKIVEFEKNLLEYVDDRCSDVLENITKTGELNDKNKEKLTKIINDYKDTL